MIKHGMTKTRPYRIWQSMKNRCSNTRSLRYVDYGGRGITVCDEWKNDFQAFYDWAMNNGYSDELTLDRIDNNGNYSPDNCRWATPAEQNSHTRKSCLLEYNCEVRTLKEWCEKLKLPYWRMKDRINRNGWTVQKAFETPIRKHKKYERKVV